MAVTCSQDDERVDCGSEVVDEGPHWLWALVRASVQPAMQVWVRFPSETAPADALRYLPASVPKPGATGVHVVVEGQAVNASTRALRSKHKPREIAKLTTWITAHDIQAALGCSRSTA